MAYWFHRNPLKATSPLTFELAGVSTNEQTRKIFRQELFVKRDISVLLREIFQFYFGSFIHNEIPTPELGNREMVTQKWLIYIILHDLYKLYFFLLNLQEYKVQMAVAVRSAELSKYPVGTRHLDTSKSVTLMGHCLYFACTGLYWHKFDYISSSSQPCWIIDSDTRKPRRALCAI